MKYSGKDRRFFIAATAGTFSVFVLWLAVYFPWFYQNEQESFFCYLPALPRVYGGEGFQPMRTVARFLLQFYHWNIGAVIVNLLLWSILLLSLGTLARFLSRYRQGGRVVFCILGALSPLAFFLSAHRGIDGLAFALTLIAVLSVLALILAFVARYTARRKIKPAGSPENTYRKFLPFLLPVWFLWTLIPLTDVVYPLQKAYYRCERAANEALSDSRRWEDVYRIASDYFDTHPHPSTPYKPERRTPPPEYIFRDLLSVDLKTALLKTGRLNSQFLSYGEIPEMNMMFPDFLTAAGRYHIPAIRAAWQAGLYVPMRIYANNLINAEGLSNVALNMIIPNYIFLGRYALAQNFLYYQSHTLAYRRCARYWQVYNSPETSWNHPDIARNRKSGSRKTVEEFVFLDFWPKAVYTPQSDSALLEYRCFLDIFYKNTDSLPAYAEHYRRLGYHRLPDYVQEALLIRQAYEPGNRQEPETFAGYAYSPEILRQYRLQVELYNRWRRGGIKMKELQTRIGTTYFFHYYCRTFQ